MGQTACAQRLSRAPRNADPRRGTGCGIDRFMSEGCGKSGAPTPPPTPTHASGICSRGRTDEGWGRPLSVDCAMFLEMAMWREDRATKIEIGPLPQDRAG